MAANGDAAGMLNEDFEYELANEDGDFDGMLNDLMEPANAGAGVAAEVVNLTEGDLPAAPIRTGGPLPVVGVRRARDSDAKFTKLVTQFPWIDPSCKDSFHYAQEVRCTPCNATIRLQANPKSNATHHASTKKHRDASHAAAGANPIPQMFAVPLTPDGIKARDVALRSLRQMVTLSLLKVVPKAAIKSVYGTDNYEAASLLLGRGMSLGVEGTMDRDIPMAMEIVKEKLKARLTGVCGAIITDGATTRLVGRAKPMVVLFASTRLGSPMLLDTIMDPTISTAAQTAVQMNAILASWGINKATQVTSLMGDNVNFNDALATEMGLPRGKCLAHSLNLVFKAITQHFPNYEMFTNTLGSVITAGGSLRRSQELKDLNLDPRRLIGYPNRWASLARVADYLLEPFGDWTVAGVLATVNGWLQAGVAEVAHDDAAAATRLGRLRAVFADEPACVDLWVVRALSEKIPELIKFVSADGDNLRADILVRLRHYRAALAFAAEGGHQNIVLGKHWWIAHLSSKMTSSGPLQPASQLQFAQLRETRLLRSTPTSNQP
jgi:hypothetical protein